MVQSQESQETLRLQQLVQTYQTQLVELRSINDTLTIQQKQLAQRLQASEQQTATLQVEHDTQLQNVIGEYESQLTGIRGSLVVVQGNLEKEVQSHSTTKESQLKEKSEWEALFVQYKIDIASKNEQIKQLAASLTNQTEQARTMEIQLTEANEAHLLRIAQLEAARQAKETEMVGLQNQDRMAQTSVEVRHSADADIQTEQQHTNDKQVDAVCLFERAETQTETALLETVAVQTDPDSQVKHLKMQEATLLADIQQLNSAKQTLK